NTITELVPLTIHSPLRDCWCLLMAAEDPGILIGREAICVVAYSLRWGSARLTLVAAGSGRLLFNLVTSYCGPSFQRCSFVSPARTNPARAQVDQADKCRNI